MRTQHVKKNALLVALNLAACSELASGFVKPSSYRTAGSISRNLERAAQTPFPGYNQGSGAQNPPFIENNSMQNEQESEGIVPTTFREAEILGLRLMQDGRYEEALTSKWLILFIFVLYNVFVKAYYYLPPVKTLFIIFEFHLSHQQPLQKG